MSTAPNAPRLFNASCLALIVTAMSFAIRGGAIEFGARAFHTIDGWL